MNNNSNSTNSDVQRGFDQQAVISGINGIQGSVTNGFAGVQQSLCNGFAGVEAGATNRQMANMQTMFGLQQQLSQCCCDNRLATAQTQALVQSENCEDRNALQRGITDVLIGSNANTQRLVDTMNGGFQGLQDVDHHVVGVETRQRADEAPGHGKDLRIHRGPHAGEEYPGDLLRRCDGNAGVREDLDDLVLIHVLVIAARVLHG